LSSGATSGNVQREPDENPGGAPMTHDVAARTVTTSNEWNRIAVANLAPRALPLGVADRTPQHCFRITVDYGATIAGFRCHHRVSRKPHGIEVVTSLGDTCLEHEIVEPGGRIGESRVVETRDGYVLRSPDGSEHVVASSLRLPCGLGTRVLSPVARSTTAVAKRPVDRWMYAVLATSLAVHLAVLAVAFHASTQKPPARTQGSSRPRLVANHTMSMRARRDPTVVHSANEADQPELRLDATPGPPISTPPQARHVASQMTGSRRDEPSTPTARAGADPIRQPAVEAARHFDPCENGDCGLIATSRYATTTTGPQAGDDYQLAPRTSRPLESSVVTCDAHGDCNTLSGNDQRDIRTEIAHHLTEIEGCFEGHAEASAAIDARVDDHGTVRVWAHDPNPVSACIAAVASKLTFASGERNVTLAFARDH